MEKVDQYIAWGRDGNEYAAETPAEAAHCAYHCKAPGRKRRPVLVLVRKSEGDAVWSVPLGWWEPGE